MKVPVSWLKDYVDLDGISIEELAHRLTMAGLESEEITFVGLPLPPGDKHDFKVNGIAWDREKIVVAEVLEVNPHPNADRLTLCRLNDGEREHTVLTGAPNLFPYKGQGPLDPPLKVAYAKEGTTLYDGHAEGWQLMTLKKAVIRGVESYSMVCSEKELGISEEHEGIMLLPEDAPTGMPLADYMGDAVLDIAITPNIARNANILGVAREIAALFGRELQQPSYDFTAEGAPVAGQFGIKIENPELNPRFVGGLIRDIEIRPSPDWVQRRLRLAGQRPINNIVDVTNYVMLDIGQPLHAFDYDELVRRAGGKTPTLITRMAKKGEKLTTLDGETHALEDFTVLVADTKGSHSIAGIMGGADTEVTDKTTNVLLEGANWNFINIRKTLGYLKMNSEASYRFSRGVHPAMASRGVGRGLELMRQWAGGTICKGLVDEYPLPYEDPTTELTPEDVRRWLGIDLKPKDIAAILARLDFKTSIKGKVISATAPDHRVDISDDPVIGKADLLEEIARIYGYDNIPETRLADVLPPQRNNAALEFEERVRDLLARQGLQEIVTYRLTSPEREAKRLPPGVAPDPKPYITLKNPITPDRFAMRKSMLASMLEILERNARLRERLAFFEIGFVYHDSEAGPLPDEKPRLVIAITGRRDLPAWQGGAEENLDYYDLKGIVEGLLGGLHLNAVRYEPSQHPSFHPGKQARLLAGERQIGTIGELHPAVHGQHDLGPAPVLAATFALDALMEAAPPRHEVQEVPAFPPVLEDLAFILDETIPAGQVQALIEQTGGATLAGVRLFDVYRGEQLGAGKKSLAYALTYQAEDRTLTDDEVAKLRKKIVGRLERELGATLRA